MLPSVLLLVEMQLNKVVTGIRSSVESWRQEKLRVLSMVPQFGLLTRFIILSAAETQWHQLIKILCSVVDCVELTDDDVNQMPYAEKARLIQADAVTCARYFDKRLRGLLKTLKSPEGPFLDFAVAHRYHRIEFQQRGSPHAHMLLWLRGAPVLNVNTDEEVTSFIHSIVFCNTAQYDDDAEMQSLLQRQVHGHTRTCKRRNRPNAKCRFGIPFMPMNHTWILRPLSLHEHSEKELARFKQVTLSISLCSYCSQS